MKHNDLTVSDFDNATRGISCKQADKFGNLGNTGNTGFGETNFEPQHNATVTNCGFRLFAAKRYSVLKTNSEECQMFPSWS